MNPGRNEPCPCGSGRKYKQCCLQSEQMWDAPQSSSDDGAFWAQALTNIRRYTLDKKPHIQAYYKIRKLHGEIVDAMARDYLDGKFEQTIDETYMDPQYGHGTGDGTLHLLQCEFDPSTREGAQALYDMLIYKPAPNMSCMTEVFLQKHRYRKEEKIAFLQSMLDSTLGLFEIVGVDEGKGYVSLKEVFTAKQFTITDVALSGAGDYTKMYLYTRIIEYQGICFGTGLNLTFNKSDPFIQRHIRDHRRDYSPNGEFVRFTQLYNQFSQNADAVKVIPNSF